MGFTAGLYVYPKKNGDKIYTLQELNVLDDYLGYTHNDWAKEHYVTFDDYIKRHQSDSDIIYKPSSSDIDWAMKHDTIDEYDFHNLYTELDSWCSGGAGSIHDIFKRYVQVNKFDSCRGFITKEDLPKLLNDMFDILYRCKFDIYYVSKAYQDKEDSDGEPYQKMFDIDGLILRDDEGNSREIWTGDESEGIITNFNYYDTWGFYTLIEIIKILIDCLSLVDFDNEYLVYEGGW